MKYGLRQNDIVLFMGRLPYRKSECIYFESGGGIYPIAYVDKKHLPDAQRLWAIWSGEKPLPSEED